MTSDTPTPVAGLKDGTTGRELEAEELLVRIEAFMDAHGLVAADLARASGFSPGHISQILNRNKDVKLGTALVLANAIGMLDLSAAAVQVAAGVGQSAGTAAGFDGGAQ